MKFLLLIPVLALFLSNVPFRMEMPMPSAIMEESCAIDKQEEMQCSPEESSAEEDCCKKETTCVCFYCLQVHAPTQTIAKFSFPALIESDLNGYYLQINWNNPFIDGPLQPPDIV